MSCSVGAGHVTGKLILKRGTGSYVYGDSGRVHRLTSIVKPGGTVRSSSYDAGGAILNDGRRSWMGHVWWWSG